MNFFLHLLASCIPKKCEVSLGHPPFIITSAEPIGAEKHPLPEFLKYKRLWGR
jgi:hypothetical protein